MHTSKEKLTDMSNSGRFTLSDFKLQLRTTMKKQRQECFDKGYPSLYVENTLMSAKVP